MIKRYLLFLLFGFGVVSSNVYAKNLKVSREGAKKMLVPVILPEVNFENKSIGSLKFGFNNCDGGFWETVVFQLKDGNYVLVSFNTPTVAKATPKQVSIAGLTPKGKYLRGITGSFELVKSSSSSPGHIMKNLSGTVSFDTEIVDKKTGVLKMVTFQETIRLDGLSFSRNRPFKMDLMLADLRSIPGLERGVLTEICPP